MVAVLLDRDTVARDKYTTPRIPCRLLLLPLCLEAQNKVRFRIQNAKTRHFGTGIYLRTIGTHCLMISEPAGSAEPIYLWMNYRR